MKMLITEDGKPDFHFINALKQFGVNDVDGFIDVIDVDKLTDLIDALMKDDMERAKKIVQSTKTESAGSQEDDNEAMANRWFAPKGKAAQSKKHTQEQELGEDNDTNPAVQNIGDTVIADGVEGTMKLPSAPGNTVGVMIDGELTMVDKKNVSPKVSEGVLGMTQMPGLKPSGDLKRIRELAGLPPQDMDDMGGDMGVPEHDMDAPVPDIEEPVVQDQPDLGPIPGDMPPEEAPMPVAAEPVLGPGDPAPADAPPPPMGMPNIGSGLEDAAALDNAISEIENLIPNVKISEYKTLVARLKALVAMAESAGKSALSEGRVAEASFGLSLDSKFKSDRKPKGFDTQKANLAPDLKSRMGKFVTDRQPNKPEVDEDRIAPKSEPKKEPKADEGDADVTRKTLMDYMKEAEGDMETIGGDRNSALAAFQARMGPGTTPQQATQAFDAAFAAGHVKQVNGQFQMKPMADGDFHQQMAQTGQAASTAAPATNGASQQPANPADANASVTSSSTTGTNTTNPGANVQGAPNGAYQGR